VVETTLPALAESFFCLDLSFAARFWVRAAKADYGRKKQLLHKTQLQESEQ